MYELLKVIKDKYRIYLTTIVENEKLEDGSEYSQAKNSLQRLVDEGIVEEYRVMYCTTQTGQIAQIRQLNSELHIESNLEIVQNLHQFMNKFHLVNPEKSQYDTTQLKKIEEFVRTTNKVLFFTDVHSYTQKIQAAFKK